MDVFIIIIIINALLDDIQIIIMKYVYIYIYV